MIKEGRSLHILGKNHEVGGRQGYSDGGKDSAAFTLVYSVILKSSDDDYSVGN